MHEKGKVGNRDEESEGSARHYRGDMSSSWSFSISEAAHLLRTA